MIPGLTLLLLVLLAGTGDRTGRPGALALAAVSVAWLLDNAPMEGAVLVVVSRTHGLTAADLAGLVGLVLAAVRLVAAGRRRRRGSGC
ncbi:MAG: hypothetical protein ACTHNS_12800 [Marmoricola sp.]